MRVNESAGYLEYYLDYIDYTSEDKEWVQVFEKNPKSSKKNSKESIQLMIRPSFPQWCYGHEVPEQFPNSVVTAIVDEAWKVGDLVDWLNEGCYWSGKITKLLDEDRVEVKLLAPPIGEGKRYPANRNDLRPTLEWSLINGWTVPLSQNQRRAPHMKSCCQMMNMVITAEVCSYQDAQLRLRPREVLLPWHLHQPETVLPAQRLKRMVISLPQRT